MAARSDAKPAALPLNAVLVVYLYIFFLSQSVTCWAKVLYSRQDLLEIGLSCKHAISGEFIDDNNIPVELARQPGSAWILPGKRRRRKRRGDRGGPLNRLKRDPHRPAIPSLFLANVRSLANKMDEMRLRVATKSINSCAILITESWLTASIPDASIELPGYTTHRQDRNKESTGKSRGGGVVIYLNNNWTSDSKLVSSHCSQDLEYITVKCRPFHLAREHSAVYITVVYIAPDANASIALATLHDAISAQQSKHPHAVHITAGDFNRTNLKTVLPKLYQHVKCATRGDNTLDKVYTNIKNGYRARQLPQLDQSDHMSLLLIPAYKPIRKSAPITTKTVKTWPEGAMEQLQDCFATTDWSVFENRDLEQYTASVLGYITHCMDTVTTVKRIRIYPNRKPWMTKEVQCLLKDRDTAFKKGDQALYSIARANLKRGIRKAKADYKSKIEDCLQSNNTRKVWQGIQHITNFRPSKPVADGDATTAEELNSFFARFEKEPPTATPAHTNTPLHPPTPDNSHTLTVEEHEVRRMLKGVNPRKATGPDGVPGQVLRECADQLAGVFTKIYNQSLSQAVVPPCMKTSTIIPVPKKNNISCLNDYRPVALTPIITKCFEKLIRTHISSALPPGFDPHQFAYRANRSTEDAIATALHSTLSHLEKKESYARLLFVDYSSAFNTIIPDRLVSKLTDLGLSSSICRWIMDFLSDRPQRVKMGCHTSSSLNLSIGSPQGCVLSPLLYSLYTYDCITTHPFTSIIKFADDTTIVGLISAGDETEYRREVARLAAWCRENNLELNISKTKELIIDFRRKKKTDIQPLVINGEEVEIASNFRFLGVHLDDDLSWSTNTSAIIKKAHQRLYFLRVLRKNNLSRELMMSFYRCSIESVLTYCAGVWFRSCTAAERKALQRVVDTAQKIIGCPPDAPLPSLEVLHTSRCLRKANSILKDPSHPGHGHFKLLPSGKRYSVHPASTNRLRDSFYPKAIKELNVAAGKGRG